MGFGAAYEKLASDRSHAEMALASSVNGLNDALAKQAALADSRFEKTVSDIQVATVSGEVIDYRAFQLRVNRKVQKEKERIEELSNKRFSESKKARGKLVSSWMRTSRPPLLRSLPSLRSSTPSSTRPVPRT